MTRPVPAARESGILRRGFLTSPAVNVMLFQASEEKSEPTWATQNATNRPKAPAVADDGGHKGQVGLDRRHAARRPEIGEVGPDGLGVAPENQADEDQREQRQAPWPR